MTLVWAKGSKQSPEPRAESRARAQVLCATNTYSGRHRTAVGLHAAMDFDRIPSQTMTSVPRRREITIYFASQHVDGLCIFIGIFLFYVLSHALASGDVNEGPRPKSRRLFHYTWPDRRIAVARRLS